MSYRDGLAAGVPARVMRISFSGERAYEVNVPANAGRAVWEALMAAGEEFGITPYGTETMHVLRAEKGYIIVGRTPTARSRRRTWAWAAWWPRPGLPASARWRARIRPPGRKQFVGLLTEDAQRVLPEGAQIVERDLRVTPGEPTPMIGHVTSSYYSPILRRSIALALVRAAWTGWANASKCRWPMVAARSPSSPARFSTMPKGSDSMRSETDMVAAAGTARLMLESPLVGVADLLRAQEGASTRSALRERAFLDLVNVRGEPSDAAFVEAVAAVAGLRLPAELNTVARGERYDALWLGPDEWLLRSVEPAPAGGLHARLSSALAERRGGGGRGQRLHGAGNQRRAGARGAGPWLPAGPAPARVQDRAMRAEPFFKTAIVLAPTGDERMDLVVRRSFADYFCRILLDAAAPLLA